MQRQRCRSDGCMWKGEWPQWSTLAKCASFSTLFAEENGFHSKDLEDLRVQWRYRRNRKLQREKALLDSRKSVEIWRDGWPSHCKIGPSGLLRDQPMPVRRRLIDQEEVWYLRNCDCAIFTTFEIDRVHCMSVACLIRKALVCQRRQVFFFRCQRVATEPDSRDDAQISDSLIPLIKYTWHLAAYD